MWRGAPGFNPRRASAVSARVNPGGEFRPYFATGEPGM